jgi:hypothetical protein
MDLSDDGCLVFYADAEESAPTKLKATSRPETAYPV